MRVRKPSPATAIALLALFVALGGSAVAAIKADTSTPLKVCIPPKEGKPITTPKGGACKSGYTLNEVNEEGPQGPAGSDVVDRVRLAAPVTTVTKPQGQGVAVPLSSATWSQAGDEVQQLVGTVVVTTPSYADCTFTGDGHTAQLTVELDGKLASEVGVEDEIGTRRARIVWSDQQEVNEESGVFRNGDWNGLSPVQWLQEPGTAITHTLSLKASDECTKGGHFTIDSVSVDVIGVH